MKEQYSDYMIKYSRNLVFSLKALFLDAERDLYTGGWAAVEERWWCYQEGMSPADTTAILDALCCC